MKHLEKKIYSQNGEDGITLALLDIIGKSPEKYFVEIGVEIGVECNCRILYHQKFRGLMLDGKYSRPEINLMQEFVTKENVNGILSKYKVPKKFDVLSIDIDSNDIYIWDQICSEYEANIVIIEYCGYFPPPISVANEYKADKIWQGTPLMGSSLSALVKIGKKHGYTLVYTEKEGVNAFFVKDCFIQLLKEKFNDHPFGNEFELFTLRRIIDWSFLSQTGLELGLMKYENRIPFSTPHGKINNTCDRSKNH